VKNSKPPKPVKTVADPSVAAAEKRCADAHASHEAYTRTIDEIIDAQDWKTLGYDTFIQYWIDRFSDITAGLDQRSVVVYAMIGEGNSDNDIAVAVKGIGPEGVANLRRQKDSGVPPGQASATSKPSRPRPNPDTGTVFVHPGPELKAYWDTLAGLAGASTSDFITATMVQVHGRPAANVA
jgi:hypothetical protein